jgi:hypothetical protein
MSEKKTIYCGSGKKSQYDGIVLTINLDDIPNEHIFTNQQNKRMVKVLCAPRKEVSQYGQTHYLKILEHNENFRKPEQSDDDFTKTKTSLPDDDIEPPF